LNHRLRIGLHLIGIGTFDVNRPGNVQGDELVARCWSKYLARHPAVGRIVLYGQGQPHPGDLDLVIHFHPDLEGHPAARNFLYLQNVFPAELFPGGTLGVFQKVKHRFDGFLFTSQRLMRACAPGAVIPFATDPELFRPGPGTGGSPATASASPGSGSGSGPNRSGPRPGAPAVTFVGNNIRGERCNQRYLVPALPFGLAIYGNNAWQAPLVAACRGKVPMEELPALYAGSPVNLNAHIPDHVAFDTLNQRLYDILACGGFVISDRIDALESVFEDAVLTTDGDDDLWAKLVCSLADGDDRRRRADKGRRLVLDRHTYAHRCAAVVEFLQTA
jgi:spore maturation protein CgeB